MTITVLAACNRSPRDPIDSIRSTHPEHNGHASDGRDAGDLGNGRDRDAQAPGSRAGGQVDPATNSGSSFNDAGSPAARDTLDEPLDTDFDPQDCPALDLKIDMSRDDEYRTERGVLVKVLQRPRFTEDNFIDDEDPARVPPAEWDRSEFPEGACVVRLRGVQTDCYTNTASTAIYYPPTDAGTAVGQASFHARRFVDEIDLCDWPIPGCPRSDWGSFRGYWWYLSDRDTDTLLVACSSSCEGFFRAEIDVQLSSGEPVCE
jgi:hypothetical protein